MIRCHQLLIMLIAFVKIYGYFEGTYEDKREGLVDPPYSTS